MRCLTQPVPRIAWPRSARRHVALAPRRNAPPLHRSALLPNSRAQQCHCLALLGTACACQCRCIASLGSAGAVALRCSAAPLPRLAKPGRCFALHCVAGALGSRRCAPRCCAPRRRCCSAPSLAVPVPCSGVLRTATRCLCTAERGSASARQPGAMPNIARAAWSGPAARHYDCALRPGIAVPWCPGRYPGEYMQTAGRLSLSRAPRRISGA